MDQSPFDPYDALASEDSSGQRVAARDSLLLTAQFRIEGEDEIAQVRIRNLSAGGLMAEIGAPLPSGTRVSVDVRGVGWIGGRIAWSAEGRVGVAFDQEIDPMLARKPVGGGAHTPAYAKPIVTRR